MFIKSNVLVLALEVQFPTHARQAIDSEGCVLVLHGFARCWGTGATGQLQERQRRSGQEEEEEEEEEESLFKADAVNEEDSERDRATQV
jgi:hypothetical protein